MNGWVEGFCSIRIKKGAPARAHCPAPATTPGSSPMLQPTASPPTRLRPSAKLAAGWGALWMGHKGVYWPDEV